MIRQGSAYYRQRESIVVVSETRGTPYKIVSLILAAGFGTLAIRNLFFCRYGFTELDQILVEEMFPNCDTDRHQRAGIELAGMAFLATSMIHFHTANATHVADLYIALKAAIVMDFGNLWISLRFGWDQAPLIYSTLTACSVVFEIYIFLLARKANMARQKMKRVVEHRD